jgi:endonuclease/exonuclease/phosphatase family metal-dependent hydrolase
MNRRTFLSGLTTASATAALGCRTQGHPGDASTATATPASASSSPILRVLTYNLHHGEGVDGRLDLERIAAVIRSANPDLVALQEIDRRATRTGSVDQAAEYIRLTQLQGWYGAAMPFQGGEYGQALLARWPLLEPRVVRLPGTTSREPRIAVTAKVEVPGFGMLRWTGLHLDATHADNDRWDQAGALLKEFGHDGLPTLLAGDFNATPDSRVMKRLLEPGAGWVDTAGAMAAPTMPAEAPTSRIDYVLASPVGAWRTVESRVLPEAVASDHRPLLAVLGKI